MHKRNLRNECLNFAGVSTGNRNPANLRAKRARGGLYFPDVGKLRKEYTKKNVNGVDVWWELVGE